MWTVPSKISIIRIRDGMTISELQFMFRLYQHVHELTLVFRRHRLCHATADHTDTHWLRRARVEHGGMRELDHNGGEE